MFKACPPGGQANPLPDWTSSVSPMHNLLPVAWGTAHAVCQQTTAWACPTHQPSGSQGMPCHSTEPAGMHSWQPSLLCRFHSRWWRHDPIHYLLPGEHGHFTQLHCRVFPSGIISASSIEMGFRVCHSIPSQKKYSTAAYHLHKAPSHFNCNLLFKIPPAHLPSLSPNKHTGGNSLAQRFTVLHEILN